MESVGFTTPQGKATIEILTKDDFPTDNYAYISTPGEEQTKVLFISNGPKSNLYYALAANPKNSVETVTPPIVPNINHDVYVIQDVSKDLLLPETIRKISESLSHGSILIIVGGKNIFDIDFKGMLPVEPAASGTGTNAGTPEPSYVKVLQVNKFTKDVDFGQVSYYQLVKPKPDAIAIASAEDMNSTLIAYQSFNGGKVVFYGINDASSGFKSSLTYPLFWNNMASSLLDRDTIQSLNYKAGQSLNGRRLVNTGFISEGSKTIAVNMLNDKESDVGKVENLTELGGNSPESKFQIKKDTPLDTYLILFAILLLFAEFLYVKSRGDF